MEAVSASGNSIVRRVLVWLALLGSAGITAFGIWSNGLLRQTLWGRAGLRQLELFAAGYAVWTLVMVVAAPRWFAPLTAGAAIAFLAVAAGPIAVIAVALILLSSFILGSLLFRPAGERDAMASLIRLAAGLGAWMLAVGTTVHFPVNYAAVYFALLAATLVARPETTLRCARACAGLLRPAACAGRAEKAALALVFFALLCHLVAALQPEIGADALAVHLVPAEWVAGHHLWPFDAARVSWSVMPLGADWLYTLSYLTGGENAAHLLNFACLATLTAMVYAAAGAAGRFTALLLAALFASTPLARLVTGSLFVENVWAALLVGAILSLDRYRQSGERWALYAAGLLCGCAAATKFGSLAFIASMAPFGLYAVWVRTRRDRGGMRTGLTALGIGLATGAATYAFAWMKTGNPIFPYENNLFHSRFFDDAKAFADVRYALPLHLSTPYDLLFHTCTYLESRDGALGFQYLPLIAIAAASLRRARPWLTGMCLCVAAAFSLLIFHSVAYARYLYPALPLFTIAAAPALADARRNDPVLFKACTGILGAVLLLNIYFLPASDWYHPELMVNPFDANAARARIVENAPERILFEYLNRNHYGEPVALFDTEAVAGLEAPSYLLSWHTEPYLLRAELATGPIAYGRLAMELGIRNFIAPADWNRSQSSSPVGQFLNRFTAHETGAGRMELRRLLPDAAVAIMTAPEEKGPPPCEADMLDDASPQIRYTGTWRRVDHFGNACGGTLTYSEEEGARIEINFTGTSITYIATKAFNRGLADIAIDGSPAGSVDLFTPGIEWRSRATFDRLSPGGHTLSIRVTRRKRQESQGYAVDLDGFVIR